MRTLPIAVACYDAENNADMPVFTVSVTDKEYGAGVHYDKARALAKDAGYERPFVCFEGTEQSAILLAAQKLNLVPRVVVVDMTEGLVHSVRCDAGTVRVICYDEAENTSSSDSVVELPVPGGEIVTTWAHIQTADIDPALKKLRD